MIDLPSEPMTADEKKIQKAIDLAYQYSQIDGAHHKAWVIDQMIRALTGEEYDVFVYDYCENGKYTWDEGIAP